MATNTSIQYQADVARLIDNDTLEVAQRYLVLYSFSDKKTMEKNAGTSWTATRFNRLPLPQYPIAEGQPPIGETLTISQVTGQAIQWADKVTFTDVSIVTIQHDLLAAATERLGMQIAEMKERNAWNLMLSGTQVNYVNQRGARASLVAGDVLDPNTVNRTMTNMKRLGAPLWSGQTGETIQRSIDYNAKGSSGKPMTHEHLVAVGDPLVLSDLSQNPTVVQAWSFSDVTRLYINEMGYWRGIHFCESNMVPNFTGIASAGPATNGVGSLTTGTYAVQVTGWDTQNFYESQIYQVQTGLSVTTGGITITTPATAGFTYAVYISQPGSTAISNLGLTASTSAPTTGPFTGNAITIPPSTTLTITGLGVFQIPPAAPATGVTVYRTQCFGQRAFACLKLEGIEWHRLFEADKSDPHNQLRIIGWKLFEGWVILNNQFMAGIESTASNSGAFG